MSIKKIIAVASAKGGVGKSTITAALASYLSKSMKIGILDADIYGPNQHILFNVTNSKPNITNIDGKKLFIPITVNNIKLNSMGFILDEDKAAVWRGPMLSGAIRQLMQSTLWGELDILFIDMPPGTGDAYLTVVSEIKPDHALLITTPSKLSIQDTLKSFSTFSKLNTNIIGFIVNNIFRQTEKIEYTEFFGEEC
ncbi:Mrp/NBP35 family ATP-binding protein [Gammaproteobacteria bacterium]|nr:Mrp/NBP35 family ATP-binding protein [Gammaproteobacteria bacterium]